MIRPRRDSLSYHPVWKLNDSELTSHPIPIVRWYRSEVVDAYPKPGEIGLFAGADPLRQMA